ncbi:hypothetical protein CsSME_00006921 [Camellia sinensis var. sinensis]
MTTIFQFHHCAEVWFALHKKFISLSRSHIHQLKNKLNSIVKKSNSMEEYLSKIKEIVNQLALALVVIDDEDLVLLTLNGLLDEFDAFKTTIRARSGAISMEELSSFFCSEVVHMDAKTKKLLEPTVAFSPAKVFLLNLLHIFNLEDMLLVNLEVETLFEVVEKADFIKEMVDSLAILLEAEEDIPPLIFNLLQFVRFVVELVT